MPGARRADAEASWVALRSLLEPPEVASMFLLGVSLAVLIGVTLGLLGGGGSILTVPILL